MNKTKIEWCDYTWNPVTGCLNNCSYCYARKIAERFRGSKAFPNGFEPTFYPKRLREPYALQKPSKIFVCSMGELFGEWIVDRKGATPLPEHFAPQLILEQVLGVAQSNPQHTFIFLTKCPQNLSRWNPWPDNAWVGVSATNADQFLEAICGLVMVKAKVRFISFEPLLEFIPVIGVVNFLDWLIIGAQTQPYRPPRLEWVLEIVEAADRAGIPVFLKDNIKPLMGDNLRQEFPRIKEVRDDVPTGT